MQQIDKNNNTTIRWRDKEKLVDDCDKEKQSN